MSKILNNPETNLTKIREKTKCLVLERPSLKENVTQPFGTTVEETVESADIFSNMFPCGLKFPSSPLLFPVSEDLFSEMRVTFPLLEGCVTFSFKLGLSKTKHLVFSQGSARTSFFKYDRKKKLENGMSTSTMSSTMEIPCTSTEKTQNLNMNVSSSLTMMGKSIIIIKKECEMQWKKTFVKNISNPKYVSTIRQSLSCWVSTNKNKIHTVQCI
jgi:hypothetical protein